MFKLIQRTIVTCYSSLPAYFVRIAAIGLCLALLISGPTFSATAADLPPIASIGLKHKTEGAVEQVTGKAEQAKDELAAKAKGLSRQVDGKAKRDIGKIESKAEKLADNGKRKATDLGEQIQDVAGSLADSVKDLVK